MSERHGYATFPGVTGCISCTYTVSVGITPSQATLVIPFQTLSSIPAVGDLTITDTVNSIRIRGMRVVGADPVPVAGGKGIALTLLDRRWKWSWGGMYGWYNQRDPYPDPEQFKGEAEFVADGGNGPFIPGLERKPKSLMRLCMEALGESEYVLNLPAEAETKGRPPVDWQGMPPAQALANVADMVGSFVVFQPVKNRIMVTTPASSYAITDAWPIIDDHPGVTSPAPPGKIRTVGAPITVADIIPLEAVGAEADGTIKPIDELSYKPTDGWQNYFPGLHWDNVVQGDSVSVKQSKELAKKWVWRAYRPSFYDPLDVIGSSVNSEQYGLIWPTIGRVYARRQIELLDRVYTTDKDVHGQPLTGEPRVYGRVFKYYKHGPTDINSDSGEEVLINFQIEGQRSLVWFEKPVCYAEPGHGPSGSGWGPIEPPELYLYTSFRVRDEANGQLKFPEWDVKLSESKDIEYIRRPDLLAVHQIFRDTTNAYKFLSSSTNEDDIKAAAQYYAKAAAQKYLSTNRTTRQYAGIYPADPDGAARQITWSVGGGSPATTTVSVGTEHNRWQPGYSERRMAERAEIIEERDLWQGLIPKRREHALW